MGGLGGRRRSEGGSGGTEMERHERLEIDRHPPSPSMLTATGDSRHTRRGRTAVCSPPTGNSLASPANSSVGEVPCSRASHTRGKGVQP
jgi:hypothetical protein